MKQIILTGDRPTGNLHVGHYVGSLAERVKLQNSGKYDEIYIMIADAQALTDNAEHPERVRRAQWESRLPEVYEILKKGSEIAAETAQGTLDRVRHAMKIDYFTDNGLLK